MPELPEVETVRRGLAPHLEGQEIAHVELRRPDLRFPLPARFAERLTGARIGVLGRRAKYLLVPLSTGETLIVHLGMSGRVVIEPAGTSGPSDTAPEPLGSFHQAQDRLHQHDHVGIVLRNGTRMIYNDPRRFGFMDLASPEQDYPAFAALGPEPLGNAFHAAHLYARTRNRKTPLKSFLLDQKQIAGLGNIYVCEALHRAHLSPEREAGSLAPEQAEVLVGAIRTVLEEAIVQGGSTLKDYRREDGALGYFQHSFRVYDRLGHPCPQPGCPGMVLRKVQAGRSTFYCAQCQQ